MDFLEKAKLNGLRLLNLKCLMFRSLSSYYQFEGLQGWGHEGAKVSKILKNENIQRHLVGIWTVYLNGGLITLEVNSSQPHYSS